MPKNLLGIHGEIRHDPLVPIVGERNRIDPGVVVSFVEPLRFLGLIPDATHAAAHEHQVALFGRQDQLIPVHDRELIFRAHQYVATVEVPVAQDQVGCAIPKRLSEPISALDVTRSRHAWCSRRRRTWPRSGQRKRPAAPVRGSPSRYAGSAGKSSRVARAPATGRAYRRMNGFHASPSAVHCAADSEASKPFLP